MRRFHISGDLQEKVEATYEHLWHFGGPRDGLLRDTTLSLDLRRELALCMYGDAIRKVPIFASIADSPLKCLAQRVELHLYTPGDLLVMMGEVGTELFIIQSGSVQPISGDGQPLRDVVLGEGSFIGELCFLKPRYRRTASVRAIEFCRAMVLTLAVFEDLCLGDV